MMAKMPPKAMAGGPVHKGRNVIAWYQPANTRSDIPLVPSAQKRAAMDDYLVSPQQQEALLDAAADIEAEARRIAISEGIAETGEYLSSFEHRAGPVVVINDGAYSNPRVSAEVSNEAKTAAAVEYGNKRVGEGRHVLGRAGAKFTNPKGGL